MQGLYLSRDEFLKYTPDQSGIWKACVSLTRERKSAVNNLTNPPAESIDNPVPVLMEISAFSAVDLKVWPDHPSMEQCVLHPFLQYTVVEVDDRTDEVCVA